MRILIFLFILLALSCTKDDMKEEEQEMEETTDECGVMNPIGFSASPFDMSVSLQFGSYGHWDGPFLSCSPESFHIYMSDDGDDFKKLTSIAESSGNYLVENLENEEIYFFKVTALHSQLDSVVSETRMVKVGLLPMPVFKDNPLSVNFEIFSLGTDGDRFLYRTSSDDWYVTSFSDPDQRIKVVDDSFIAIWNPHNENEVTYREKLYIQIASNTNGVTSKSLRTVKLDDNSIDVLHEISDYMDFGSELDPEKYWISAFDYSLDMASIYFSSNKDNGSFTLTEKKVFNNIWKLNLDTRDIEPISDFLPDNFELKSFVEDPLNPNNFYILGGYYGEVVQIEGAIFNPDQVDVYYYNSTTQALDLILETDFEEKFLDVNPSGEKLLITNASSGKTEIWSYDLATSSLDQITQSITYRPNNKSYNPNWTSDTEFMVSLIHEDVLKLAVFEL